MDLYLDYESPVGHLLLSCSETGLTGIWMNRPPQGGGSPHPTLLQAAQWLDGYFTGKPAPIDFPLAPQGTPFQRLIWELLLEIPYGETVTYVQLAKELAQRRGLERMSAQAVGGAVGHNPISIIIPCHRVLGAGGQLIGYAGGLDVKRRLLELEGAALP